MTATLQEPAGSAVPFVTNVLDPNGSMVPPSEKATWGHAPEGVMDDLPASYRVDKVDIQIARPESQFFRQELSLARLHCIMHWLWLCGQTAPPRALHHQLLMDRRIVITERLDSHLVWGPGRIYLKPLPRWLIRRDFWEQQLEEDKVPAPVVPSTPVAAGSIRTLRSAALGFLQRSISPGPRLDRVQTNLSDRGFH